jgi:murein DD-endopeptidase MepM/ murein hydrolase activator NlpD
MQPVETHYKNLLIVTVKQFPKTHLAAASSLAAVLCLALILFPSENAEATRQVKTYVDLKPTIDTEALTQVDSVTEKLLIPNLNSGTDDSPPAPSSAAAPEEPAAITASTKEFVVKSGDSLSVIFQRAGLSDRDLYELINASPETKELRRIRPGEVIAFNLDNNKKLEQLTYIKNQLTSLQFTRTDKSFQYKKIEREPEIRVAFRHATINSSLFLAGKNAGLASSAVMELANIFAWDIDFAQDIQRGDQFKVMYEEKYLDDKKIGNGAVLAVEFVNKNKTYKAVRYTDKEGYTSYYTPEGESMRKAFLRMPIDFARISSHFNLKRKHPVLHTIRAHKGTDYAAPRGTPIKAAGDGKVIHASGKGGYGNTVIIQHGQGYKTLYAHMHNFGRDIKAGSRVRQGQVIGYVGTTGLSTGPHLHYEFHVNGVPRNPMTIELPKSVAINNDEKARFKAQTSTLVAQLDQYQAPTQLALVDSAKKNIN